MIRLLAPAPDSEDAWSALAALHPSALSFNEVATDDGTQVAVYFDDDDPDAVTVNEWAATVADVAEDAG